MNAQYDKGNNNINRINDTPIINNYISNSPIINIYPFKNDNVSSIKTEKSEAKNNNENLIQFKSEINEDNNINICYKSYDFKDHINNQDKNMNHYFSFSKYIYYNYEVDDKLSPQIIENSDDKNNSNDKITEINIINENNNFKQNQMDLNKNGYYYVYCQQKKDISQTPFNINDSNKNCNNNAYMFNKPDNNLKNKLGNNYLTKKKFYNEDFVDTNFLRFKNKNFSPDYTINKSRFINHKIVDKNKLNIRTPDYIIPSFVKRAISHEKPINLVKKYYDHNFIMEEDNEDETIFDDKKEIKHKSISKEQTSTSKEEEKENKKLMSNDFRMNIKENNIKNIINNKLLGNEENSYRDRDGQNLVNKFINYMKEKNQCVMNLTNSDKISTSINSNNFKKDKSKMEDIINDSENQIETSIKVYNNIANPISNKNDISRNLYKSNFANINKDEKIKSEDTSKCKIVKCEKKISIINIKALLNEIKKNNNVNQILENNKIKIMNHKNSNNSLNNININNSSILTKKSDNKTLDKKNTNIKMNEENKFNEINKNNNQINNNDNNIKNNEDKDKQYNKSDYKNLIINKNKIVIKGPKIIKKENLKKKEIIKLKEQKKVNLKEKDNFGEKCIVKMYKENSILERSKINNTTTSFNKKSIIDTSSRDKSNLRMKYKINKKYNSKIINIDKVKDNILPNKNSINKFSRIRKLKTNLNINNHKKSKKISVNNIIENFKKYNNIFKCIKFDIGNCYKNRLKRNNSLNNSKLRKNDIFIKGINLNNDSLDKIDKRIIMKSSNKSRNKINNLINFTASKINNKFKKIDKKKNYKYKYYNSKIANLKNKNKNLSDYNINSNTNSSDNTALQSQSQTNQLYISHNTIDSTKQYIKNNIIKKFNNDFRYKTQSSSIKIYNKESLLKSGNPLLSDNLNFSSTSKSNNFKIIQNKLITKKEFPKTVMSTGKHKKINLFNINMFNLSNKFTSKRKIVRMTLIDPKIISEFDNEVLNKNNSRIITSINNSEDFAINSNFMFNSIHRNKKNLKGRRNDYNNNKAKSPDYEGNDYKKEFEKEKQSKNKKKKDKIFYSTIDYTNDGNFYNKIIKDINIGNKK